MARTERRSVTIQDDLVEAAEAELEANLPPFLQGQLPTSIAVSTILREGIVAMRKKRLGDDADLSDVPEATQDQRRR